MHDIAGTSWAITGAAGTIGRRVRAALRERGVQLRSLDVRDVEPVDADDLVSLVDLDDLPGLERSFAGVDGIVHLGGLADEADFHDLAAVNVVGTYHVLEAARRAGVPTVVYASSNRVTGMYPTTTRVDPEMPPRPDGFYGVSKVAGEALCRLYADKFGVRTIVLRIGSYEAEPTTARERSTWLSHDDAIRAVLAAMRATQQHAVLYAVSANREAWWDLGAGEAVGFVPQDDASAWSIAGGADEPQGGAFATPAYSLERMRDLDATR
ncbi:NAD-dependent epimerase/dehydratase family protein [Agrococcus jejuensis]|uniref:NAD-dependent epimerase/dehydratase family protein n=1 Tax=Agrococcus jejuensis TaxID=399736 RepID=UPI0018D45EA0|nr:NAD(P)-dependent oxidoreductase [Agrococcus jejuensis]